jgi:hypothetical protein
MDGKKIGITIMAPALHHFPSYPVAGQEIVLVLIFAITFTIV